MGLGALNSDWTLTHALSYIPGLGDLPSDITTREDRPEASDLLHRWGVLDPKDLGPFEKMGVDIIGGSVTDPLTLVGGVAKSVAGSAITDAAQISRQLAQRTMYVGLSSGGGEAIQAGLKAAINSQLLRRVAAWPRAPAPRPRTWPLSFAAMTRLTWSP
jgi:hypothetical protein